ncbi:MAG: type II toxin-antitoxin system VapC family toxin [Candidatus Bathyarchaeia archaeon]
MIFGLDTNIICYALDEEYPEHKKASNLLLNLSAENKIALNPTTIHETYHTLVFGQKWIQQDAAETLRMLLKHPYIKFLNQTLRITTIALTLSVKHGLGGRDALIIANFLVNEVPIMYTHDREILNIQKISWKNFNLTFNDPLIK